MVSKIGVRSKILVVDDEPEAVELVGFNLEQAGFAVVTAADGAEALTKARSSSPSLIVLDLMLPEVSGLEVCKMLRRDSVTEAIPIIMLTAKAAELDRVLGLELGADDYITKPFSPRELVLRVKKLLQRGKASGEERDTFTFGDLVIDAPRHVVTITMATLAYLKSAETREVVNSRMDEFKRTLQLASEAAQLKAHAEGRAKAVPVQA
jgi:two-component system phosphate regulon response regulator PhoB